MLSPSKKEKSPLKKRHTSREKDGAALQEGSLLRKDTTAPIKMIADDMKAKRANSPPKKEICERIKKELPPNIAQALPSLSESNASKVTFTCEGIKEVSSKTDITSSPKTNNSSMSSKSIPLLSKTETVVLQKKNTSPPLPTPKLNKTDSTREDGSATRLPKRENSVTREAPVKTEKLSLATNDVSVIVDKDQNAINVKKSESEVEDNDEESNGVGDKIKIFEKVASEANNGIGRVSRSGSVRLRVRSDRTISEIDEDLPPATPFKDGVKFDLPCATNERHLTSGANNSVNILASKWQRSDITSNVDRPNTEPQRLVKPEFKPISSPADVTIRSPSLGAKIADRFPSQGTAFRNVASPDTARATSTTIHTDDETASSDFRMCKLRSKDRHCIGKSSSGGYYNRGAEEIWLVKKKDIEEIEERVLDSFRRVGGSAARAEPNRASHEPSQAVSGKRHAYARSESHDPTWAGARAHTLKRQSSVACTCGHDRKTRARTLQPEPTIRPRSRSHGDDTEQQQVLDKYETLV